MVSLSCPQCGSDILKIIKSKSQGQMTLTFVCLNCNHKYRPDEAQQKHAPGSAEYEELNSFDDEIVKKYRDEGRIQAIKYCKDSRNWDLKSAKNYVDNLAIKKNLQKPKEGCFIATACYGDYNAPEVMVLRQYRDDILAKTIGGRMFISSYYSVSPFLARIIQKMPGTKKLIRKHFLRLIVNRIAQKTN